MPARNEGERVAATVHSLLSVACVACVVVVDDASEDDSGSVAEAAGAQVLRLERRSGKGAAVEAGLARVNSGYVAFIDADLEGTALLIEPLAAPVLDGRVDVAIAEMPLTGGRRGFGWVTGLARWAVKRYGGLDIANPLCGQRVMTRAAAEALRPLAPGFALETRATILHGRLGHRIAVVPVEMSHRRTGRDLSGFRHRAGQFWDVAREVGRWVFGAGQSG